MFALESRVHFFVGIFQVTIFSQKARTTVSSVIPRHRTSLSVPMINRGSLDLMSRTVTVCRSSHVNAANVLFGDNVMLKFFCPPTSLLERICSRGSHRWIVGPIDAIIDSPLGERSGFERTMAVANGSC